jgi:Kef-type K+ transport system membrane component KefB
MSHTLQLLLLLTFVIVAAKLAGAAANRIGQPAVFGELLAGLLLGPTLLNILGWPIFAHAAASGHGESASLLAIIRDLAELGVILLMFIAGMETNLDEMRRVGKVAFWSAVGGVALPMSGGILTAAAFGMPVLWEGVFIGTILTATSVSISAQTLIELRALQSKTGSTILGAAVIDDVIGIVILSMVVALARAGEGLDVAGIALVVVRMVLYFVAAIYLMRVALPPLARFAERLGVSQGLLAFTLMVAFVAAWAAEYVGGVAAITGAYLAGVMLAQTRWREQIDHGIHPLTYSMFVPVFFISIGLQANGRELGEQIAFTIVLVAVAIVAKAVGCALFAWLFGFTPRESVQVGAGMISRGEVGLIVAGYGLANGIITQPVFSASVIMVLATTMITPPLLRLTYPRQPAPVFPRTVEETIAGPPEEAREDIGGPRG